MTIDTIKNNNKNLRKVKKNVLIDKNDLRLLFDVQETLGSLKSSLYVIEEIVAKGGKILVVGTKQEYQPLVFDFGRKTSHSFFNGKWVNGLLTNFTTVSDRVINYGAKIDNLGLADWERNKRVREFLDRYQGIAELKTLPDLIIFLNAEELEGPIEEASSVNVLTMGLLNTGGDYNSLNYAVPANDNSVKTIGLFLMLAKMAIKKGSVRHELAMEQNKKVNSQQKRLKHSGNKKNSRNHFKKNKKNK
jgi:small subunit ribosomal protein S2